MKSSSPSRAVLLASGVALATLATFAAGKLRARAAERRNPARGAWVGDRGRRLHYVQQGSGADIVLIHGAAVTLEDMRPLIDALSKSHRVTAFDRPGHGYSDPAHRRASPERQARAIHDAVEALGVERPIVVGHSLGGAVALAYGAAFAEETAGVVAVSPLAYPGWGPGHLPSGLHALPLLGPVLSHTLFAVYDPLIMRLAPRMMFAPQSPPRGFKDAVPMSLASRPVSMRANGAGLITTSAALSSLQRRYADYPVPVHVIVGERDMVLKPARQGLRLARSLPDAGLIVLPGLGHMLHHFHPETVVKAVGAMTRASRPAPQPRQAAAA